MKPIKFPEVNSSFAESQEQYITLPCHMTKNGVVIACFELDETEIKNIVKNKKLWIHVLNGNAGLQPFMMFAVKDYFSSVITEGVNHFVLNEELAENKIENMLNEEE